MYININNSAINTNRNLKINNDTRVKTMEKISSGFRINRASDDAAGLAISENFRFQINGYKQATRNIQDGVSLIQTAEGAMQELQALLQRMNILANQSSNGIYNNHDREQIQAEFNELKKEINNIAENTVFNGINLLNGDYSIQNKGSQTNIVGSKVLQGNVLVNSENDTFNFVTDTGVFTIGITHGQYTPTQLVDNINLKLSSQNIDINAVLLNGKLSFQNVISGDYPLNISGSGIEHMLSTSPGSRGQYLVAGDATLTPFITIVEGVNDNLTFEVDGVPYSITIEKGTYIIPKYADNNNSTLANVINEALKGQNIPIIAGYGGFSGDTNTAILTFKGNVSSISNFGGSAQSTLLGNLWRDGLSGGNPTIIYGEKVLPSEIEIISGKNDTLEIDVDGITKTYTIPNGIHTTSSLILELNNQLQVDNINSVMWDGKLQLRQNDGSSMNIKSGNLVQDLFYSYEIGTKSDKDSNAIVIQTGAYSHENLLLDMPNVTNKVIGVANLDIMTASNASNSLMSLKNAINQVSTERSKMGAYQNRLEHTFNNVQNYIVNISSAYSRIHDADIALEITKLLKSQILEDAQTAMLAQINTSSQYILKLLNQ